ncbi:MAG: SH3 domain-containing protein [Clostridiales bacterium]|nr:SH3 domain-containing protein [Clostridiales bacterium]
MKRFDWKVFVLLGIIVSVAVGFLYGTGILGGDSDNPGSSGDPLISQSYADSAINQRVRELDERIASLEAKVRNLEDELAILPGGSTSPGGSTATPPASGGSAAGSGAGSGTGNSTNNTGSSGAVSSTNVGKTASVTAEVVNLRESASTSSNIKQRLTPNDTFTITKADNGWYQVQLSDGTLGWVFGEYVKVK